MESKLIASFVLYALALTRAVATIILSYTRRPGTFDAEPLLGKEMFCLAVAGINEITNKEGK